MLSRSGPPSAALWRIFVAAVCFAALWMSAAAADEPTAAAIDEALLMNFPKTPHSGFTASIVHAGRLTYVKGFGLRDGGTPDRYLTQDQNYYHLPYARGIAPRRPADAATIYQIGSVTKQFTAAAILRLHEQRRLDLDAPVNRYAPEMSTPALTVRMLLNQRSGLPDLNTLTFLQRVMPLSRRADGSFDEVRVNREIAALPRDFAPGSRFGYSNSNYFVLGTIVERISGEPLATFFARNFFGPLGMTRTALAQPASANDVAVGYRLDDKGVVRRAYPWNLRWLGGAGALTSTAEDLARWDVALLAHRVLQPASLDEMWHGLESGEGQGAYAMGWVADAIGSHRYVWHNGEVGGYHALNVLFPDDDLGFSILTNLQDAKPEALVPGIAALYFSVGGLDRVLPHSAVVVVEASLAVSLGALAIAIVAVATLRRFYIAGATAAVLALVSGFLLPSLIGYFAGGLVALVPVAGYVFAVRRIPRKIVTARQSRL